MIFKIVGAAIVAVGAVINFGYAPILKKLLKIAEPTQSQIIKTKFTGLLVAIVGALMVFFLS
ncbi:MAG: hypothetical protein N2171_02860 [Clostridia bacterium]|nr:hypothetical protein [Clostridia bacterium]